MPENHVFRIVLVEDRREDRAAFQRQLFPLRSIGCESWIIKEFAEPERAVRYLDAPPPNAKPDILVCDLDFSGRQEGLKLVEHASGLPYPLAPLILSQSTDRELRSQCLRSGAFAYINKLEFEEMGPSQIRDVLLDVVALSGARSSSIMIKDWEHVQNGSVSLGHDLLKVIDESRYSIRTLMRASVSDIAILDIAKGLLDRQEFASMIVQDFTESVHIIKQETTDTQFCLRELVERVIETTEGYWRRRYKKESLQIRLTGPAACQCKCNETRLRRTLVNVLDNAVKFSRVASSVSVSILDFESESGDDYWAVVVVDNGPGVPEDQISMLSRPLVRLEHTSTLPGTGFGLHSCVALMQPYSTALGGAANPRIRNTDESGLEVTIFVPKA